MGGDGEDDDGGGGGNDGDVVVVDGDGEVADLARMMVAAVDGGDDDGSMAMNVGVQGVVVWWHQECRWQLASEPELGFCNTPFPEYVLSCVFRFSDRIFSICFLYCFAL